MSAATLILAWIAFVTIGIPHAVRFIVRAVEGFRDLDRAPQGELE